MKILLRNTTHGLIPLYDDDFEEKKKLSIGKDYFADIKVPRNIGLHRKYWSLISCAWDLLSEKARVFFGTKEGFRKTAQVAAGYCERIYNLDMKSWVEVPRSIAFDKMKGDEFERLYNDVREVLLTVFLKHITIEQFEETMMNY